MIVPSVERSRIGIRWLAAALILAAITGASLTPGTAQAQPVEDLALHRPTTVSSATPNHPGSFAVDGKDHTFWQPKEDGPPAAFVVHLERNRPVDRVLLPRHPGVDSLVVEAWTGSAWTQVFSGETGSQVLFGFEAVSTDRLRLLPRGEEPRLYEVEVYAVEPQPVFVNQSGYNLQWPKRFTAPRAENGASFEIRRANDEEVLLRGAISGHVGDFSSFRPEDEGPYEILVEGKEGSGRSVPFMVGPHWMERVSYGPALDFMADVRCWWGDARTYAPTDEDPDCPSRGVAWRDATQYSFEVPTLVWMYLANPSAFSPDRMPVEGAYLGLRKDLPEDTPEIVRLIYWGVDVYLRGEVDHALLKEQLAYSMYRTKTRWDFEVPSGSRRRRRASALVRPEFSEVGPVHTEIGSVGVVHGTFCEAAPRDLLAVPQQGESRRRPVPIAQLTAESGLSRSDGSFRACIPAI